MKLLMIGFMLLVSVAIVDAQNVFECGLKCFSEATDPVCVEACEEQLQVDLQACASLPPAEQNVCVFQAYDQRNKCVAGCTDRAEVMACILERCAQGIRR